MTLAQGHLVNSRSMEGKVENSFQFHIYLMEKNFKFLLHTWIAYDLRVCHDFDPESVLQVPGLCLKTAYFLSMPYLVIQNNKKLKSYTKIVNHVTC